MKPIRILFDGTIFEGQKYGGISRYFVKLLEHINALNGKVARVVAPFYNNEHLLEVTRKDRFSGKVLGVAMPPLKYTGRARVFLNKWLTQSAMITLRPDIFHKTYYTGQWPMLPVKTKRVVTIHDLIYEILGAELPETELLMERRRFELQSSDLIICVSEQTKRDLLQYYQPDESKIRVVYHGVDDTLSRFSNTDATPVVDGRYLLYVGKRDSYKNFKSLAVAWGADSFLSKNFKLVCFGGGVVDAAEMDIYKNVRVAVDQIVSLSGDDRLLSNLYRHATAFIYPSKYEGFGFPPLEAMSMDCPVVCSNASCIPEIVGDAGAYFDPDSTDAISGMIKQVVENEAMRSELVKRGKTRLEKFTWQKCAQNTVHAYESIR